MQHSGSHPSLFGPWAIDSDVADNNVLAQHGIQLPHWRTLDGEPIENDVGVAIRLNEVGAQMMPIAEDTLLHRDILVARIQQRHFVFVDLTIAHRTVLRNVEVAIRKGRWLDPSQNARQFRRVLPGHRPLGSG